MNAIEVNGIWKKYRRGEKIYSLRDLIPQLSKNLFSPSPNGKDGLQEEEFWVLKDINFEVQKGEIIGIIGPNGAGKSTILKLLSRIIKPTQGEIKVKGRLSALIEVTAGFHPDFTGRENVYFNGAIYGMSKAEIDRKFDQIVEFSGVREFIDTPVKRYSSGMSARLGFAVAAHVDPDVLLVDEVLSVGDMYFQAKCAEKIRELVKTGATIIFISHSISAIQSLCQRVLMLNQGEIVKAGLPEDVIPYYENIVIKEQEDELKLRLAKIGNKLQLGEGTICHISAIRIGNSLGQEKEDFAFEEPLQLSFDYDIKGAAQDIAIQYDITRADGTNCCTGNTRDHGFSLKKVAGKNSMKIDIGSLPLSPGAYYAKVSIWDKDMINLYVAQRKRFNINSKGIIFKTKAAIIPKVVWSVNGLAGLEVKK